MQLPIVQKRDPTHVSYVICVHDILPVLVEGYFPADQKGCYLAAWEEELLS